MYKKTVEKFTLDIEEFKAMKRIAEIDCAKIPCKLCDCHIPYHDCVIELCRSILERINNE